MLTLAKGDITKRDEILWGYTIEEAKPYVDFIGREILFREAVLSMLGVGKDSPKKKKEANLQDTFCRACKQAGRNMDCDSCDKSVEVLEEPPK